MSGPKQAVGHSQFIKIPTCNEANLVHNELGITAMLFFKVPVRMDCSFPTPGSLSKFIFISTINQKGQKSNYSMFLLLLLNKTLCQYFALTLHPYFLNFIDKCYLF